MRFVIYGIVPSAVSGEKCLKDYGSFEFYNEEEMDYDWYSNSFHSEQEAIEFIEKHKKHLEYTIDGFVIARIL